MITPADAPREALLSKGDDSIRLVKNSDLEPGTLNLEPPSESKWTVGRAGMMYRDLIPDRLGGKVIASHIRIVDGGEVADSVHYHKIDFQIIYCLKGAIRVVYEDQGEPFWLRPGDCVLQPPEIRHRVLEAEAGSEVIEITSPAEHETWFDHAMKLPTETERKDRSFGDQTFVRHIDSAGHWTPYESDQILTTNTKIPGVRMLRHASGLQNLTNFCQSTLTSLKILIEGKGIEMSFAESALHGRS